MQNWLVPNPHAVDIKLRDTSGPRGPSPTPDHPAQGFIARKINLPYFWLLKPVGVGWAEETAGFSGILLEGPAHRLTQTHSLWAPAPHQGSPLKGTSGI